MKAVLLEDWGRLKVTELARPEPGGTEALLRVRYGGICGSDITIYRGQHMTAKAPVVLCHEILGLVEELPAGYQGELKRGDRVAVNPIAACGSCAACRGGHYNVCDHLKLLGIHVDGGFAEYVRVETAQLVRVPEGLSDRAAALSEPFAVACHVTARAEIGPGQKVFLSGAGTIGQVIALAARERGAERVVLSEPNPARRGLAEQLGLEAIDPYRTDPLAYGREVTGGDGYDVVIDASGSQAGVSQMPDLCRAAGVLISTSLSGQMFQFPIGKVSFRELRLIGSRLYTGEHFRAGVALLERLAKGYPIEKLVTEILPLERTPEGIEAMAESRNVGKILIACGG